VVTEKNIKNSKELNNIELINIKIEFKRN